MKRNKSECKKAICCVTSIMKRKIMVEACGEDLKKVIFGKYLQECILSVHKNAFCVRGKEASDYISGQIDIPRICLHPWCCEHPCRLDKVLCVTKFWLETQSKTFYREPVFSKIINPLFTLIPCFRSK